MPSEKEVRQRAHELEVFRRFCTIKLFEIVEGTVTQSPPRAPDIGVEIVGDGVMGFELVCIDDVSYLRGLNLMPESAKLIAEFHEMLTPAERAAFDGRYRDATLHVHFIDTAGQRGVRRTLRPLFDAFSGLPAGWSGPAVNNPRTRVAGVRHVYVSRHESFSGPEFGTPGGGMITGLNLRALEAKLDNGGRPVELLAYGMEISRVADDEAINALLDERMPASSYRKVWIYEHMLGVRSATTDPRITEPMSAEEVLA